jgi:hypothetical protein
VFRSGQIAQHDATGERKSKKRKLLSWFQTLAIITDEKPVTTDMPCMAQQAIFPFMRELWKLE